MNRSLTIISHTEHYATTTGTVVGLSSTVMEINQLLDIFDEIYHVAMLHQGTPPQNTLTYDSDRITFVPIPAVGGTHWRAKLYMLKAWPEILSVVRKTIKKTTHFQFRAPYRKHQ